jgi:hypothetical protein
MGLQQTYGGVARIIAPLFFGWSFDRLGVSSPYFFASAFIVATILLGLGLDKYARHEEPKPEVVVASDIAPAESGAVETASPVASAGSK